MAKDLADRDPVYRKPVASGWVEIDPRTDVLRVPGGMVVRCLGLDSSYCTTFVPCDNYDRRDWLVANEANL